MRRAATRLNGVLAAVRGGRLDARALDLVLLATLAALYGIEVRPLPGASPLVLGPYAAPDALAGLLFAIALAALLPRRRVPWLAAGVTLSAAYAFRALEYPPAAALDLAALVALHGLGSHASDRGDALAVPLVALWVLAVQVVAPEPLEVAPLTIQLVVFEGAWSLGRAARAQRRNAAALAERAQLLERARIARELHDVIGHHVTVAVVQAEAAEAVLEGASPRAPGAPDALSAIRAVQQAARQALAEARQLTGVLRSGATNGATPAPSEAAPRPVPRTPPRTPSMTRAGALVEDMRAAGLEVALAIEGDMAALPPAVDLAAYRVLQEALTNALRHAPASTVWVRVRYGADALLVEVANDAPTDGAAPHLGEGHGLQGIRERVAALGGTIDAAPRGDGGFLVRAELPLRPVEA